MSNPNKKFLFGAPKFETGISILILVYLTRPAVTIKFLLLDELKKIQNTLRQFNASVSIIRKRLISRILGVCLGVP